MSFFRSGCFLDLACVVTADPKTGVVFHPQLPGYLADLSATCGPILVGLAFSSWVQVLPQSLPGGVKALLERLHAQSGMSLMQVHELREADPMGSLLALRRRLSLDFKRCSIYLSPREGTPLEVFAREVGFGQLRMLDALYVQ